MVSLANCVQLLEAREWSYIMPSSDASEDSRSRKALFVCFMFDQSIRDFNVARI